ncbi:hypothetical protein lerEdw1_004849 [Lerista edwardsae]|nr:hypothetical protein lerEdw1_004849 [Lerista edwardsae]
MLRALRRVRPPPLRHRRTGPARERTGASSHVMVPVPLSYAVLDGPSPQPPLVFLHGLFGSKSNFQSLAKKLVLKTQRKVLIVDARNHGKSPHSPLMTYEAMSADVQLLFQQLCLHRCVLIGHSMGGKTAMVFTLQRPDLVERLVCVDISPRETTAVTGFQAFIAAMSAVDIPQGVPRSTARRLAEEQLRSTIQDPGIRHFLLKNLVNVEDQFVWRVNLKAISQHLCELMGFPDFQASYTGPTLFLGGLKVCLHQAMASAGQSSSSMLFSSPCPLPCSSDDYPEIERLFPEAEIQYIASAGHWVHADQPEQFITAICNFLEHPPT